MSERQHTIRMRCAACNGRGFIVIKNVVGHDRAKMCHQCGVRGWIDVPITEKPENDEKAGARCL